MNGTYPGERQDQVIHGEFGTEILFAIKPQTHKDQRDDRTHNHRDLHGLGIAWSRHLGQRRVGDTWE